MTSIKKLLTAGACAGLLALGAAPALSVGPMMSPATAAVVEGEVMHKAEFRRRHHWQRHGTRHQPPRRHYYGHNRPPYGHAYGYRYGHHPWSDRNHWGRSHWRDHRGHSYHHHDDRRDSWNWRNR